MTDIKRITYKIGDMVSIPYETVVEIEIPVDEENCFKFTGKVVGKATTDITQCHIVQCTDESFPNENYKYDTIVVPLPFITVIEEIKKEE